MVNSGVPQGSHLGPALFILFINDIVNEVQDAKILIFADDVKIYHPVKTIRDCVVLQKNLNIISNWSILNDLPLNLLKCKLISFHRSKIKDLIMFDYEIQSQKIDRVKSINDLGVMFDVNLDFKEHIENITSKAYKSLGFITRSTKEFKNVDTYVYLYKTIVLPTITYCSQIWSPHQDIYMNYLESIQRKFMRRASYKIGRPMLITDHDYSVLAQRFDLCNIKSLHKFYDLCFVWRVLHGFVSCNTITDIFVTRHLEYGLRHARLFIEISSRDNFIFQSSKGRLIRLWNLLPHDTRNLESIGLFKSQLRSQVLVFN